MKSIDPSLRNASVLLAGGACLVPVLTRFFNPYGWLPIRGAWLASMLVIPLLCFWCGMLLHYRVGGKARVWLQAAAGLAAAYMFYLSRHTVNAPSLSEMASTYLFAFFLGIALPWDHLRENGDHLGAKSAVLCVLTALSYAALYVVWQRLDCKMQPRFADMEQFLLVLTTNMLPLAMVPPLLFAVELSFSKAGQWLGSRKWFLWLAVAAALISFLGAWFHRPWGIALDLSWETARLIRLLVQPVSVYLMIVIWRVATKLFKGLRPEYPSWKEGFNV
jgi:hypothetical protein